MKNNDQVCSLKVAMALQTWLQKPSANGWLWSNNQSISSFC